MMFVCKEKPAAPDRILGKKMVKFKRKHPLSNIVFTFVLSTSSMLNISNTEYHFYTISCASLYLSDYSILLVQRLPTLRFMKVALVTVPPAALIGGYEIRSLVLRVDSRVSWVVKSCIVSSKIVKLVVGVSGLVTDTKRVE